MEDALSKMTPGELVAALVVTGLVATTLIVAVGRVLARYGRVAIGPVSLDPIRASDGQCISSVAFLMVLARQAEYINQRRDIKQSILPDQMRYAEAVSADIRGMLLKAFSDAMHSYAVADSQTVVDSLDYHLYRISLRIMHEEMREWIRECFRENHFQERTAVDFDRYVQTKIADGIQVATETLDDLYRGQTITRRMVSGINAGIIVEIRGKIESIFREARRIAIEADAAIESATADYNAYVEEQTRKPK